MTTFELPPATDEPVPGGIRQGPPRSLLTPWRGAEAEALDAKYVELGVAVNYLEHVSEFLERDLTPEQMASVRRTIGLLKSKQGDYVDDAERLRHE
jgi:hypothetical protein